MASALVTGGAGFIGAHVARHLLDRGYRVVVLDDLSGGSLDNVDKRAFFVRGSIEDADLIHQLFGQYGFEHVFHLAAYAAEGLSHFIRRYNYSINLIGSINLINAAVNHGCKCFVFTSSISVYGSAALPMRESCVPTPEDPYGIAKYATELDLRCARNMFGLNFIVFRPHNVYGELQNIGDRYRNVVGIFMNQLMQNKPLTIFGDGEQTRAFSYIGDVAPLIARSVEVSEAYNQVFNIGSDRTYTVNQLAQAAMRAMNRQTRVLHLPGRQEVKHAYAAHDKLRMVFGNMVTDTPLHEGMANMARWAMKTGPKTCQSFDNIEIEKNLPETWQSSPNAN